MKTYVNLLPWSYRRGCLVRRRVRQWSIGWGIVALAVIAVWLEERSQWQAALAAVESQEQRYDEVRALRGEIARLTAQKKGLGSQQDLVGKLQQAPPPLLPVALVSASAQKCEGRVAVRRLTYDEHAASQNAATAQASAQPMAQTAGAIPAPSVREPARLTLEGIGADNVAVAEFVVGLRESGAFGRVDLKSAAATASGAGNLTSYQVECGL